MTQTSRPRWLLPRAVKERQLWPMSRPTCQNRIARLWRHFGSFSANLAIPAIRHRHRQLRNNRGGSLWITAHTHTRRIAVQICTRARRGTWRNWDAPPDAKPGATGAKLEPNWSASVQPLPPRMAS